MKLSALAMALGLLVTQPTYGPKAVRDFERDVAMADKYNRWQSTTGDFTEAAGWSQGVAPDGTYYNILDGGVQTSVTGGLGTAAAANAVLKLVTTPDFSGDIGLLGNPLWIQTAPGIITHRGTGTMRIGGAAGDLTRYKVDSDAPQVAAHFYGALAQLHVVKGYVIIDEAANLASGYAGWITVDGPGAELVVEGDGSGTTEGQWWVLNDGAVHNSRVMTAAEVIVIAGGEWTQTGLLRQTGGAADTVVIHTGGTFNYEPTAAHVNGEFIYVGLNGTGDFTRARLSSSDAFHMTIVGSNLDFRPAFSQAIGSQFDIDLREDYP